jgi:hypothetical protein
VSGIVDKLNNRYLVAIIVGLFLLHVARGIMARAK